MGKVDYKKATEMYSNNASIKDIAKLFGVTQSAIWFGFKQRKVQLRKRFSEIRLNLPIEKIAYVAGLFDGEGSINISRRQRIFWLTADIGTTDKKMTEWLCKNIGGHVRISTKANPKHKTGYHWTVCSNQAASLLKIIQPYLIIKNKESVVALRFQKLLRENRNYGRLSIQKLKERENLKYELEALR